MAGSPINASVFIAAIVALCVGLLSAAIFHWLLWHVGVSNNWPIFFAKIVLWLVVAIVYFTLCIQPPTAVQHRGVVSLFGKRVRLGPGGLGYREGLNATPLPKGIMTIQDVNTQEQTMDLGEVDEFSKNDVVATADSSANWRIKDPYVWLDIADATATLKNIVLQMFRDVMMDFRSHATRDANDNIVVPGIIDQVKDMLADTIEHKVNQRLEKNRTDAHRNSLLTDEVVEVVSVQIRKMDLPDETKTELNKRENEFIQKDAERIQAESRGNQADIIKRGRNVSDEYALAVVLNDAGKTGVEIKQYGVGKSLSEAADSLAATIVNAFRR